MFWTLFPDLSTFAKFERATLPINLVWSLKILATASNFPFFGFAKWVEQSKQIIFNLQAINKL